MTRVRFFPLTKWNPQLPRDIHLTLTQKKKDPLLNFNLLTVTSIPDYPSKSLSSLKFLSSTCNLLQLVSNTWNLVQLTVRALKEELQLLQEPGSYVGEVVKVMGKSKVLVKVSGV